MVIELKKHYWLFLFFLLAGLLSRWHFYRNIDQRLVENVPCKDVVQGCSNSKLDVHFSQPPAILKPFVVTVKAEANTIEAIFEMQGMEMGLNRYRFKKINENLWQAEVILPVCVQGRSDWLMRLELGRATAKLNYQIQFSANR